LYTVVRGGPCRYLCQIHPIYEPMKTIEKGTGLFGER
jgi:hypothetical protein